MSIDAVLPGLRAALRQHRAAVLVAPPGSGKTTRVPLALLDEPWLAGSTILMLEPRRVAARAAASFMAELRGEQVGRTVGYRMRGDTKVSAATRIEVVTERLLTRRLQSDPSLDGVGLVIFDEVHERSIDTDLGLALCIDVASGLRDDLRILAMSATLDTGPIANILGDAPVLEAGGAPHPIDTRYVPRGRTIPLDALVSDTVRRALADPTTSGDVLVFLPGRAEIGRTSARLADAGVSCVRLTAGLPARELRTALRPAVDGSRRVVLATAVAQTSLTIDGVRVVIDAGLERRPRFDPGRGMSSLETIPVSRAAADQRRGRAGRQGPGVCIRLWAEHEQRSLRPFSEPEILIADLAPLALDLACWGVREPSELRWFDPPPMAAWAHAVELLRGLDAIDDEGRVTAHGRRVAELGAHPRLGHLMVRAGECGDGPLATLVAAVIESGARGDLRAAVERPAPETSEVADRWARRLGVPRSTRHVDGEAVGPLVALAFEDRLAHRRAGQRGRFLLTNGVGAEVSVDSPLADADWLAIAELDRRAGDARITAAAPLSTDDVLALFGDRIERSESVRFVESSATVECTVEQRLGAIVVRSVRAEVDTTTILGAVSDAVGRHGVGMFRWSDAARELQRRAGFARMLDESLPDVADEALVAGRDLWLPGAIGLHHGPVVRLGAVEMGAVLATMLTWPQRQRVDELAPTQLVVPSGRSHRVTYGPDGPVLAVKLQEMFGAPTSPTVGGGRVPVTLHLLSPAGRSLQVTQDLASFWAGAYREVRGEMRGRYPKHPWPEDPTAAAPTARTTRRAT